MHNLLWPKRESCCLWMWNDFVFWMPVFILFNKYPLLQKVCYSPFWALTFLIRWPQLCWFNKQWLFQCFFTELPNYSFLLTIHFTGFLIFCITPVYLASLLFRIVIIETSREVAFCLRRITAPFNDYTLLININLESVVKYPLRFTNCFAQ